MTIGSASHSSGFHLFISGFSALSSFALLTDTIHSSSRPFGIITDVDEKLTDTHVEYNDTTIDYKNLIENVLELESQEEIDFGHKQISKD